MLLGDIVFYAHSTDDDSRQNWHLLRDHLTATGAAAAQFAGAFGAGRAGRLAGLLHDLGKYTPMFQKRLTGMSVKVDHATAGAVEVKNLLPDGSDAAMAELVAFAIAGHHAGLADRHQGGGALADRLKKTLEPLDPVWREEITPDAADLMPPFDWNKDKLPFQFGLLGRMIFSCLVDADYRDTESFYSQVRGEAKDRDWPALDAIIDRLRADFDGHMAGLQTTSPLSDVNRLRRDILAHVRARADQPPGLFTLTVPTGGGKTLTSLGFALDHAKRHGLRRIIYAIPFTTVIDQTAGEFRKVLGEEHILEHHSAFEEEKIKERQQRDKLRLTMEDWAAPIVVTTNVQLFESLFSNRPSRCRKLHNLAGSVIVLDEAQTLPLNLLRPCMETLRELTANYGVSVVLCTATQPALDANDIKGGLPLAGRELAPDPQGLAAKFKRATIELGPEMGDEELVRALAREPQALVIVNSRGHALSLYRRARDAGLDGLIHLTTRQYAAHRQEILKNVREHLQQGQPCRLIATSLVEAGVDLDFPRVWRAEAGLDQITQAAGRCNREGKRPLDASLVTVFKARDNPPPFDIRQFVGDLDRMKDGFDDLSSPAAIKDYFGEVYWRKGDGLDAEKILDKFKISGMEANFSYRTVAEKFRMIQSGLAPVIIARDADARKALDRLKNPDTRPGAIARALQRYIVQVPPRARHLLLANGHVKFEQEAIFGDQFCVLQTASLYTEKAGLIWENADYLGLENSVL